MLAEWVDAFTDGPGIIVIRNAFPEHTAIDKSNAHYWAIIEEERLSNVGGGDHFAKSVTLPARPYLRTSMQRYLASGVPGEVATKAFVAALTAP